MNVSVLAHRPGADGSCYVTVSAAAWGLFQGPILVVLLSGLASVAYAIYRLPRGADPLSVPCSASAVVSPLKPPR
jgi:hypothetical protein